MVWDCALKRRSRTDSRQREEHARDTIGERNHRTAAQRVEQPAEQQRAQELPAAKGRMYQPTWFAGMPRNGSTARSEEDRVVENAARHQRQSNQRLLAVGEEECVGHSRSACDCASAI